MALEYAFDKAKLPRGLSFPLKRGVLDAALMEAGLSKVQSVYYWQRQRGHIVLRADYLGEGHRGWAGAGRSAITVYAVPSSERQAVEQWLVSEVLPRMISWLGELERSGNVRRGVNQHLVASWQAGAASIEAS